MTCLRCGYGQSSSLSCPKVSLRHSQAAIAHPWDFSLTNMSRLRLPLLRNNFLKRKEDSFSSLSEFYAKSILCTRFALALFVATRCRKAISAEVARSDADDLKTRGLCWAVLLERRDEGRQDFKSQAETTAVALSSFASQQLSLFESQDHGTHQHKSASKPLMPR